MEWELVIALLIAVPIVIFPAAYIWYLNAGGIYAALKARQKKAAREKAEASSNAK